MEEQEVKEHELKVNADLHEQTSVLMLIVSIALVALLFSGLSKQIVYPMLIPTAFGAAWFYNHSEKIRSKIENLP